MPCIGSHGPVEPSEDRAARATPQRGARTASVGCLAQGTDDPRAPLQNPSRANFCPVQHTCTLQPRPGSVRCTPGGVPGRRSSHGSSAVESVLTDRPTYAPLRSPVASLRSGRPRSLPQTTSCDEIGPGIADLKHGLIAFLDPIRQWGNGGRSAPKQRHVRPVHPGARDAPASRGPPDAPFLSACHTEERRKTPTVTALLPAWITRNPVEFPWLEMNTRVPAGNILSVDV